MDRLHTHTESIDLARTSKRASNTTPPSVELMRSAILQLPDQRTTSEQRQVLRAAIRQLDRAELYLAAVAYMDLGDRAAQRALNQLRTDLDALKRHLAALRAETTG
jgi:hypothetical protein